MADDRSFNRFGDSRRERGSFNGGGSRSAAPRERQQREDGHRNVEVRPGVHRGSFKWFDFEKGYGFIVSDAKGEPDMFAHISALDSGLVSVMREVFAEGGSFSDYPVCFKVGVQKAISTGQSSRRNNDKPFAMDVVLASDTEEDETNEVGEDV